MSYTAEELLDQLDPQQRLVATTFHRPLAVLAGAGSGKTRALSYRIAYGVLTGKYRENRTMALTFTSKAADEMRMRLNTLGVHGAAARTFHAAALSQLRYFWPLAVGGKAPFVLDGKAKLLAEVAETMRIRIDTSVLRDVAAEIEWRKVNQFTIEQYLAEHRVLPTGFSQESFAEFQHQVERLKTERHQLDFEDVLLTMVGMLETEPVIAEQVRQQYRSFLVDEYQDVSPLQQRLLELWLGGRDDLMVVGDIAQTIYSFAGANAEYLRRFQQRYPDAEVIKLETNYRSTPAVVGLANQLMQGEAGSLELVSQMSQLVSAMTNPEPIIAEYAHDQAEASQVAAAIAKLIASGIPASEIAVLYRIHVQGSQLEDALNAHNIRYQVHGGQRFFELREIRQAIMLLKGAALTLANEPVYKAVDDVLYSLGWRQESPQHPGAARDTWDSLNLLREQIDPAVHQTLGDFVNELMHRLEIQHAPTPDAVTLATIHSAKGMEWSAVFVIGLAEGLLPSYFATSEAEIAEEKRLLYVAITRAKRYLQLSYAKQHQRGELRQPSRFLGLLGHKNNPDAAATPV